MKRLLIVLSVIITVCRTSEAGIQTVIAETEAARPTETAVPASETPTSTNTSTPTPTNTVTPSPTPDLRIIFEDSSTFLLKQADLPENARYYLPSSDWISPHTNKEIVNGWGREDGLKYIDETGRIEGWWVLFKRGSNTIIAPEEIFYNVIRYETAQGAQLTITKYGTPYRDDKYEKINLDLDLGDEFLVSVSREMQSNGKQRVWYRIEFSYRNYVVVVDGYGWEDEVTHDYVYGVAQSMLAKLEAAPLANP